MAPVVLLVVSFVSGTAAALDAPEDLDPVPAAAQRPPAAPLLSARRVPAVVAAPVAERRLAAALEGVWAAGPPTSCLEVSSGDRVLFERESIRPVVPASALKLVTAAAVLENLGPDARFRTTVEVADGADDGVIDGDIWLIGSGDPVLGTAPWAAHFEHQPALVTPLEALADGVADAGVREIRGRVLGDEDRYDRVRYVPSWPERYAARGEVGPATALTVNDGFAVWEPGQVPYADPAAGGASVLTDLLRARGVTVVGSPAAGSAPEDADELAAVESPPMADLVGAMLRESDNGTAELLLKELGVREEGEGSTEAGAMVVTETLEQLELPLDGVRIVDGSGLDPSNTVTCDLLIGILRDAERGGPLDAGLAVAGLSGTLMERFGGTTLEGRIRAKTGSINGVAALTGWADAADRTPLAFAYILNGVASFESALPLQAQLGAVLVGHPDIALEELGPAAYGEAA